VCQQGFIKVLFELQESLDFPAGLPDCPGFHLAASLPETPGLNFVVLFIVGIPSESVSCGSSNRGPDHEHGFDFRTGPSFTSIAVIPLSERER
jgi:hypothetical protein